ncbi:MAG TPA: BamA/TamA family outer membrane protein, partial [Chitinophagaceae bacterium]|nr:BamA/TamA family outer membrane protein [Chitinophagaceae bacterium]
IYNISGKKTVAMLKKRRDDLKKYAARYYKFLSEQVNITGTKEKEIFEVARLNNDSTLVVVYKDGKGSRYDRILFERTFLQSETKEIRLYGLGDDDIFTISGNATKGITVRVIGGKGVDSVTDHSLVKGLTHKTKIYDEKNTTIYTGSEARKFISNDTLKNDYHFKSFKFDWVAPVMAPGYNLDDGFFIGGGIAYKKQQFGKAPYGQMHLIAGNYSFATSAYSVWYKGMFREFIGKADLNLSAKYNSPTYVRNFYGLGNETVNREDVSKDYYRVRMSQLSVSSAISRQLGKYHSLTIGNEFQSVKLQESENRFIESGGSKLDSTDYDRKNYLTSKLGYQFNNLDNELYPRKGIKFEAGASYTQNVSDRDKNYVTLHSEASIYNSKGRFTLASRAGIATNVGNDYEFYQANYLGGLSNLRGFRKDRFAGKTSVYQTTELRVSISNMNAYFVKGVWGVLVFADNGRVWMPEESSDTWHHGYGGGLWFLPFNKMAMTATYGVSKEDKLLSITAGFLF